jgi:hypothetical protein
MVDPLVAELVHEFNSQRIFDNDLDAWRAAKGVVRELDRMAREDDDWGALAPRAAGPVAVDSAGIGSGRPDLRTRRLASSAPRHPGDGSVSAVPDRSTVHAVTDQQGTPCRWGT